MTIFSTKSILSICFRNTDKKKLQMRGEVFAKPSHFPREIRASRGQTKKSARRISRSGELSSEELLRIESCRQLYPKKRARILSSELEAGISSDTAAICSPIGPAFVSIVRNFLFQSSLPIKWTIYSLKVFENL